MNLNKKILDYSKFCVSGIEFIDGQKIDNFRGCVSYGVSIHEKVDIEKMNEALGKLYHEVDCFHMHLSEAPGGVEYFFDENISEKAHIIIAEGNTVQERLEFAKQHLVEQSAKHRNRFENSPFWIELFTIDENETFLAAYLDRYISDGHSIGVALMKLLGYYENIVIPGGKSKESMRGYIKSLDTEERRNKAVKDADYWLNHLAGYIIEPYVKKSETNAFEDKNCIINIPKASVIKASRALRATLGNLLTAAYHLTLMTVFGSKDNVISYVSTDRNTLDEWGIIGPFVKPLNSRISIELNDSVKEFVKKISVEAGENLKHKDAHIDDIKINRYGMSFLNHSKPFLTNNLYTQWMPDLYMDQVEADFIYLRIQELEEVVEVSFVCNRNRICKEDYESVVYNFQYYLETLRNNVDSKLIEIVR